MTIFIQDEDLQRLTARFLLKAMNGQKTEHKCQFPGARLYRITDDEEAEYQLFEQAIGDGHRARGQRLYYLYTREGREPVWRMVIDYLWKEIEMIQDSIDVEEAHSFLDKCLIHSLGKGNVINMPELNDPSSRDGFFFYDDVDGKLRSFNGQRYVTTRARQRRTALDNYIYLAEIQGGTFF